MESTKASLGFLATYWSAFLACILGGYSLMDTHIFWASILFTTAIFQGTAGMWLWFGARWKRVAKVTSTVVAVGVFAYFDYGWIAYAISPTYAYLLPTSELIDGERRAFFIQHSGPRPLQNVEVALLDNKSGTVHVEKYGQLDRVKPSDLNPKYFWFTPSSPWDEDYTVTIVSSQNPKVTQRMIARSTKHTMQFAVEVTFEGTVKPIFSCRDPLMPSSYTLARDSTRRCDMFSTIPEEFQRRLDPPPYGVELADGSYRLMRQRTMPTPSDLDAQSENRHLWEYGEAKLKEEVSSHGGMRLLILTTAGTRTRDYAHEFYRVFKATHWMVSGPELAPPLNERMIDLQVSARRCGTETLSILRGLTSAGAKHREKCVNDTNIPENTIVLWIGPRSPSGVTSDDCLPAEFSPRPGEHHTCEMTSQARMIPFPPP
jgi:hypothetical protein